MRYVAFALFASVGQLLNGCGHGLSREVLATILSTRGQVVCSKGNSNDFHPLDNQGHPAGGDTLRTSNEAEVCLVLVPGILVKVGESSELKIEELRLSKNGNETEDVMLRRVARMVLIRGKVDALLQRRDESEIRFSIGTGRVTISADRDCLFQVEADNAKTRVLCTRGKIYAAAPNQQISVINAGYFQEWPSRATEPTLAADDARAQIDLTDTLEAERQLRDLGQHQPGHRPF
jgi:hypothetical protein